MKFMTINATMALLLTIGASASASSKKFGGFSFGGTPAAASGFFVWNISPDSSFEVKNGEILWYVSEEGHDIDNEPNLNWIGVCTKEVCSSGEVRAVIKGESVKKSHSSNKGDLLIMDFGWKNSDDLNIQCPHIFQTPTVEILGCDSDTVSDCEPTKPCSDPYPHCFDKFDFVEGHHAP
eukprot:CAMPEP_0197460680 /NCGR_PEP_ID=MMETSP1175-20131217/54677_1 /TAXON_ID=1003142 /ORGANISM="Triceratium dubium, Strain CCMP147" /LENGTH=178 /DNA_ID=CAMNT_0042995823 /DNA_START=25 /DNA_END=558 /DNA_ORIENTATION=+